MLELFVEYRADLQFYCALVTSLVMLRWGGGPERAIAIIWLVGIEAADYVYHALTGLNYQLESIDPFHATMDAIVVVGFLTVALYANRIYPLWIAALQLLAATSHLVRELVESITPIAYAVMVVAPSWGILVAMIFGITAHLKRQRRFGEYRGWRGTPPLMLDRLTPGKTSRPGAVS